MAILLSLVSVWLRVKVHNKKIHAARTAASIFGAQSLRSSLAPKNSYAVRSPDLGVGIREKNSAVP